MANGAKDRFIEVALKRVGPDKFNRQNRRADERTQNPAKLAAKKQIADQPGEQDFAGDAAAVAERVQQAKQPHVCSHAGEGDDNDLRELNKVVGRHGDMRLARERGRVPDPDEPDARRRPDGSPRRKFRIGRWPPLRPSRSPDARSDRCSCRMRN